MTRCADCRHFDNTQQRPGTSAGESTGMCRYASPVANPAPGQSPWPFCKPDDWCGRFAERPT